MAKQIDWLKKHEITTGKNYGKNIPNFYYNKKYLNYILNFIPKKAIEICDLGCGSGIVGKHIKDNKKNVKLTFIDANPKQLKGITKDYGKIKEGNLLNLNINQKFDCIITRLVNHYFSKKQQSKVINKIYELLNDKGIYISALPLAKSQEDQKAINKMFQLLEKGINKNNNFDRFVLTKKELKEMLKKTSFKKFQIKRFKDYNIKHSIKAFEGKFNLNQKELGKINTHLITQTKKIKNYMGITITEGIANLQYPMFILIAKK